MFRLCFGFKRFMFKNICNILRTVRQILKFPRFDISVVLEMTTGGYVYVNPMLKKIAIGILGEWRLCTLLLCALSAHKQRVPNCQRKKGNALNAAALPKCANGTLLCSGFCSIESIIVNLCLK